MPFSILRHISAERRKAYVSEDFFAYTCGRCVTASSWMGQGCPSGFIRLRARGGADGMVRWVAVRILHSGVVPVCEGEARA